MELTGVPLLGVLALLCVGAPAALLLTWSRVRGPVALRAAQRVGLVLVCQVSAVLLAGVAVNDQFQLYDSWTDLVGSSDAASLAGPQHAAGGPIQVSDAHREGDRPGRSTQVESEEVVGARSGVRARVWVILPPGYASAQGLAQYPLVEFLPGYPGQPSTWLHAMHLADVLDQLMSSGQVQPFVAVLPVMTVEPPRDTECTDVPGGPAVATWLAQDVPDVVRHQLRIRPAAQGWGVVGYSTGGFCATKLAMQYPQVFRAAASLSGYYTPATDASTGGLFAGDPALLHANSPLALASSGRAPATNLLLVSSRTDPSSWPSTQQFLAAVRRPVSVDTIILPDGGHNTGVWNAVLPQSLQWLLAHLGGPPPAPAAHLPIRALR